MNVDHPEISDFCVVGLNHWEATIPVREKFSLDQEQYDGLIDAARREGLNSLFCVSTCNRTELYARDAKPEELIRLLTTYSNGSLDEFHTYGFQKCGRDAAEHLFQVAVGLDSQILGDLQIIKQVKEGYEYAAGRDAVDGPLHRLMQYVFRAHKRSRNETSLGHGAATTAYAAVQFAQKTFKDLTDKEVLLVGTGKIGKVTVKNLLSQGVSKLTLVNRSRDRAEFVADRFDLEVADYDHLPQAIADADVVIVATGAPNPIISLEHMQPSIEKGAFKLMLDLSVPRNIDPEIEELDFVDLANMDWLSDVTDEAYRRRERNVPRVKEIIQQELGDYEEWLSEQRVVPTIKALTSKLDRIRQSEIEHFRNKMDEEDIETVEHLTRRIVNKIAAHSIEHLRDHHRSDEVNDMVQEMFKLNGKADKEDE